MWRRVDGAGNGVALTFDDGDRPVAWNGILDALAAGDVRATFFLLGTRLYQHPELAAGTVAAGHAVGSHAWDHARLTGMAHGEVAHRLQLDREAWEEAGAVDAASPTWFRPPYGAYDGVTLEAAASAGFPDTALWDVDPEDWREPGAGAVTSRVLKAVRPGSIVLLHVVEDTAAALPEILTGLAERRLAPVTLPQLVAGVERANSCSAVGN